MNKLTQHQERHYGLDLLRIVSMFLIVMLHVLGRSGAMGIVQRGSVNYYLLRLFDFAALGAVNCYAMLSGYVGAGKRNRLAGIGTLWLQVFVYSFGITLAANLLPRMDGGSLLQSCFPVVNNQYWYFTSYFIVFLFAPVLNIAVEKLSLTQLTAVVLLGGAVYCSSGFFGDVFVLNHGYSAHWIAYLYLVGGLVRRAKHNKKPWKWAGLYLGMVAVNVLCQMVALKFRWEKISVLKYYNSPLLLPTCLGLFLFFTNCKIRSGSFAAKLIGVISPLTFGIYLIHTHPIIFDMMGKLFHRLEGKYSFIAGCSPVGLVLGLLGVSAAIFLVCAAIEWVRALVFRLLHIKPLLQKLGEALEKGFGKFVAKLKITE